MVCAFRVEGVGRRGEKDTGRELALLAAVGR